MSKDQTVQALIKKIEFWQNMKVGDYVACRYADREGYIRRVVVNQVCEQSPFATLEVRTVSGTLFIEHPEHLMLVQEPTPDLKLVG